MRYQELFQSRNRGSFIFKGASPEALLYLLQSLSIPRSTNFRTRGDNKNIA